MRFGARATKSCFLLSWAWNVYRPKAQNRSNLFNPVTFLPIRQGCPRTAGLASAISGGHPGRRGAFGGLGLPNETQKGLATGILGSGGCKSREHARDPSPGGKAGQGEARRGARGTGLADAKRTKLTGPAYRPPHLVYMHRASAARSATQPPGEMIVTNRPARLP